MKPYFYIQAWGRIMENDPPYIEQQVALANREDAPDNAIYKSSERRWKTFDEIASEIIKQELWEELERLQNE